MGLGCVRPIDSLSAVIPRTTNIDVSAIKKSRIPIIFLIGGPGAGKATQDTRIKERYGFCYVISQQLLRNEVATGSQRGIILAYLMSENKLIPSDVMIELIKAQMLSSLNISRGFLLIGFPNEKNECTHFDKQIRPPDLVLYLSVRNTLLMNRILARIITSTERRESNFDEQQLKQIKTFSKIIKRIMKYYRKQLIVINGEKNKTKVFNDICEAIDNVLVDFPSTLVLKFTK